MPTGSLGAATSASAATLLLSGRVLVVDAESAELYDPATGVWTPTATLNRPRSDFTTALLTNGKVLAAGGFDGGAVNDAELYDEGTGF